MNERVFSLRPLQCIFIGNTGQQPPKRFNE